MHGPLYLVRVKSRLRAALRLRGYTFRDINDLVAGVDHDMVDVAAQLASAKMGQPVPEVEGSFLDWLEQFLNSEFGKLLIDMLMKLLLGLI